MIREIFIRPGRAGTLETLKLIDQLGWEGSRSIPGFILSIPLPYWDATLRSRWDYEAVREVEGIPAQQGFQSIVQMISHFQQTGRVRGDCAEAAVLVVAVAIVCRLSYRIVAVRPPDEIEFSHVFVEVTFNNYVYRIDPTAPVEADYTNWERMTYP